MTVQGNLVTVTKPKSKTTGKLVEYGAESTGSRVMVVTPAWGPAAVFGSGADDDAVRFASATSPKATGFKFILYGE